MKQNKKTLLHKFKFLRLIDTNLNIIINNKNIYRYSLRKRYKQIYSFR